MNEIISTAVAALGVLGSVCSVLAYIAYVRDRLVEFRLRRRRKKMMDGK